MKTRRWASGLRILACAGCLSAGPARAEPMLFVVQVFPPFVMEARSESEGAFPDIVRAVCAAMKTDCRVEIYPWRRALRMAEEGDAHGILVIQKLPEREQKFFMSPPIVHSSYVVVARQDMRLAYVSPRDLDGFTIGVYGPSATSQAAEGLARAMPSVKIVMETDNATVLRKLVAMRYGEKAAGVMNADVARYLMRSEDIGGLAVSGEIRKIEYFIGLSRMKFDAARAARFMATLGELERNGTVKAIIDKYQLHPAVREMRAGPSGQ